MPSYWKCDSLAARWICSDLSFFDIYSQYFCILPTAFYLPSCWILYVCWLNSPRWLCWLWDSPFYLSAMWCVDINLARFRARYLVVALSSGMWVTLAVCLNMSALMVLLVQTLLYTWGQQDNDTYRREKLIESLNNCRYVDLVKLLHHVWCMDGVSVHVQCVLWEE